MSDTDAANRYQAYRMGWRHGATGRAYDERLKTHADENLRHAYTLGYTDGGAAFCNASAYAADAYDYHPPYGGILRSEP